jgi:hypothetical protein
MVQPRFQDRIKRRRGFAALISVLLIGGVGLVSAVTSAALVMQESAEIQKRASAVQARASAYSCASIAVLRLKKNSGYTGNENISVDKVICSIGATVFNGNARTLYAQATVNGLTSRIKVDFTGINSSQFYLNSWTEIPPT